MFPPLTTAASFVPSLEDVIPNQSRCPPPMTCSIHVTPESVEVKMFPPLTTAATIFPSLEEVILQKFWVPAPVCALQLPPESEEVQTLPLLPLTTAASLVKSLDDAISYHVFPLPTDLTQAACEGANADSKIRAKSRTLNTLRRGMCSVVWGAVTCDVIGETFVFKHPVPKLKSRCPIKSKRLRCNVPPRLRPRESSKYQATCESPPVLYYQG